MGYTGPTSGWLLNRLLVSLMQSALPTPLHITPAGSAAALVTFRTHRSRVPRVAPGRLTAHQRLAPAGVLAGP